MGEVCHSARAGTRCGRRGFNSGGRARHANISTIRVVAAPPVRILAAMNTHTRPAPARDFRRIARAIEFIAERFQDQPSLEDIFLEITQAA